MEVCFHTLTGEAELCDPANMTETEVSVGPYASPLHVKEVHRTAVGGFMSRSGRGMVDYLCTTWGSARLEGRLVVELGAGTGVVGMAAARLGARRVVLTDQLPLLPMLRDNVLRNGFKEGTIVVEELNWCVCIGEVTTAREERVQGETIVPRSN